MTMVIDLGFVYLSMTILKTCADGSSTGIFESKALKCYRLLEASVYHTRPLGLTDISLATKQRINSVVYPGLLLMPSGCAKHATGRGGGRRGAHPG